MKPLLFITGSLILSLSAGCVSPSSVKAEDVPVIQGSVRQVMIYEWTIGQKTTNLTETRDYDDHNQLLSVSFYAGEKKMLDRKFYSNTYDDKGRLLISAEKDAKNSLLELYRYKYDDAGHLIEETGYDTNGYMRLKIRIQYDKTGLKVKETKLRGVREEYLETVEVVEYTYDRQGRLQKSVDDEHIVKYTYDKNGNLSKKVQSVRLQHEPEQDLIYLYQYDHMGRVSREELRDRYSEIPLELWEYGYDISGRINVKSYFKIYDDYKRRWRYTYDDTGNLVAENLSKVEEKFGEETEKPLQFTRYQIQYR